MAKKKAGTKVVERALPGMEEENLPPALEKAIAKFHDADRAAKQSNVDHRKAVDTAFATVKTQMHEHNVREVKLRIDGQWKRFKLLNQEKGKFEKIKQPRDQKARATRSKENAAASGGKTIADKVNRK